MNEQDTHADIIAEMRFHGQQNIDAEKDKPECGILTVEGRIALNYADRLEAAHKRECGDCAKLREALEMVRDAHYTKEVEGELCEGFEVEADDGTGRPLICVVEDALAAPPRNCDRFATIDEARKAHEAICEKYGKCHNGCPLNNEEHYSAFDCFEAWLYATSTEKEGGAK